MAVLVILLKMFLRVHYSIGVEPKRIKRNDTVYAILVQFDRELR